MTALPSCQGPGRRPAALRGGSPWERDDTTLVLLSNHDNPFCLHGRGVEVSVSEATCSGVTPGSSPGVESVCPALC